MPCADTSSRAGISTPTTPRGPIGWRSSDPARTSAWTARPNCRCRSPSAQADVNVVFLILGVVALLAGGLGIANATLLSVMERVGEIGLRRALGATKRNISSQFMVQSVVIGLLGGLIGAALGVLAVVIVSAIQQWAPIATPGWPPGQCCSGSSSSACSQGFTPPARHRTSNIEPIVALRGGS